MIFRFGEFELNERTYQLRGPRGFIPIERRVLDLLLHLIRNRGRVVTKSELYRAIWSNRVVSEASLSVAMAALRRAIGDDGASQRFVATHHGRGYRFVAEAHEVSGEAPIASTPRSEFFVGRSTELATARELFSTIIPGPLRILLVSGEAGIGKTRLLTRIREELERDGANVFSGNAPEGAGAPAFWPWIQVLREYFDGFSPQAIASALTGIEDVITLVPEVASRTSLKHAHRLADPTHARFRLFDAISNCLVRAARQRPIALALDDLQNFDDASLLLLTHLANSSLKAPILVVATTREAIRSDLLAATLAKLQGLQSTTRLKLQGLNPSECSDLLHNLASAALAHDTLADLCERTQGNPLFLTHVARHIPVEGRSDAPILPNDLASAIALHISDLTPPTREVLTAASVVGPEFSISDIDAMNVCAEIDPLNALEEAAEARVVTRGPEPHSFRFRHALLRDALYSNLGMARRAVLHERFARALAQLHGPLVGSHVSVIAHHYHEAAATGCWSDAIAAILTAAAYSAECLAYEESARFYQQAIDLIDLSNSPSATPRSSLLLRLGAQLTKAGQRGRAREVFEQALSVGSSRDSGSLVSEIALSLSPGVLALESGVVDSFLIDLLEEALGRTDSTAQAARSRLMSRLSLALHWSPDASAATELAAAARAIADGANDSECLASALQAQWSSAHGPLGAAQRLALSELMHGDGCIGATDETRLVSHLFRLYAAIEQGDSYVFLRHLDAFRRLAARLRQPQGLWFATMLEAMDSLLRGRFDRAAELSAQFAVLGNRAGDVNAAHSALGHAAYLAYERDQTALLLPEARRISDQFRTVDVWKAALAWMEALEGRADEAWDALDALGEGCLRSQAGHCKMDFNGVLCLAGEAAALVGHRDLARRIYSLLVPMRNLHVIHGLGTLCWGPASRVLGLLAWSIDRSELAIEHLREAVALSQQLGTLPWLAHSRFELGRILVTSNTSREDGIEYIRLAMSAAEELQMPRLTRQIRSLKTEHIS